MILDIKWNFAKNDGGRETGFHDAGVETFKGNFDRYLAREVIQNSLDARHDPNKPVLVDFQVRRLKRSQVPDMDGLRATFARCAEYWNTDKKAVEFFHRAEKLASNDEITVLEAADYNTRGVRGGDDERDKDWYNLLRCAGSSAKGGGEGGSFGIGKNAPFAASWMRAVLYSTKNIDGQHAFQGVATIVSHVHPEGGIAQPTGFLGGAKGISIRSEKDIPKIFLRGEFGTNIVVLGFPHSDNWGDDLTYSVLDNFWPAINFGDLEVRIGKQNITKNNLAELLEKFSGADEFTAHRYYQAFNGPSIAPLTEELPTLRECTVYLLTGTTNDMPKKIAMIRRTGMKIFEKPFRSIVPFCGVFICRNEVGNKLLRDMEPPRHDTWDQDYPEKGAHKKTNAELVNYIRGCIKQLAPADDGKAMSVPGLNKYLPDDDETPEESFDDAGSEEQQKMETFKRIIDPAQIKGREIELRKPMQPDKAEPGDDDSDTELVGSGTGSGGGGNGTGQNDSDGGNGTGGGGDGTGGTDESKGGVGGSSSKPAIPIRYRTFASNTSAGVYKVSVTPEKQPLSGFLSMFIWAVGDDRKVPAEVSVARLLDGTPVTVSSTGALGPISVPPNGAIRLEVVLREPLRVAMEVSAHEA
jgi:hypothetical protein